ncbi:Asp23/Gls24 family envelope stress response protein [Peribacillus sp. SIMBA_075]
MRVSVQYGAPIHQVCHTLQEKVKESVEALTGLFVEAVNVRVETIEIKNP